MDGRRSMEGRYALVTGGSRGIGRAIADALAGAGCNLAIASRNPDDAARAAAEILRAGGVQAIGEACDVSDRSAVHELFGRIRRWSGDRLDVLVCNAGYAFLPEIFSTPLDATHGEDLEEWCTAVFRTDTLGSVFCTHEALPVMMAQKQGSILYMSSIPALAGFKGTPYTIAKAGILGLMRDVALEYGKYNIRANALALGNIQTHATFSKLDAETQRLYAQDAPLGRWGQPEDVAQAALFLVSESSSFVTGQTLVLDGGIIRR